MVPLHKPLPEQSTPDGRPQPHLKLVDGGMETFSIAPRHYPFLMPLLRGLINFLPAGLPMWIYTILLKPAPLRNLANSLLLKAIPERVTLNGVVVVLNSKDPVVSSALSLRIYESYETKLIAQYVRPGMQVLDVGANVGYYTALLANQVGTEGHVTAFEPEPGNYNFLCQTVRANDFHNVKTIQGAVSAESGESFLFLSEDNQGDHRLYATKGRGSISVPIVSIDTCLPENTTVDFVKMDIQGSEGLALQGMQETLRRSPRVSLLTEFWPDGLLQAGTSPLDFLEMLKDKLSFSIWEVDEKQEKIIPVTDFAGLISRNRGRAYTNLLCMRKENQS